MSQALPVICLMGPTASGKTALAIELAQALDTEIISVDSALVYRGMDIGTAKPTPEEQSAAQHHLIDIIDPAEAYSAADFRKDALNLIDDFHKRGKIPLLVGGTMLYFKSLVDGISPLPSADSAIRAVLEAEAKEKGWSALHDELKRVDPVSAQRIHPNDPQRINRALEVFRITGQSMTELTAQKAAPLPYSFLQFSIAPKEKSELHERIEQRFHCMLEQGFEAEVQQLLQRGDLHADLPSIRCVGYRQMWDYLQGELDYEEMVYRGVVATRQLAKRQMTWLRGWPELQRLETGNSENLKRILSSLS